MDKDALFSVCENILLFSIICLCLNMIYFLLLPSLASYWLRGEHLCIRVCLILKGSCGTYIVLALILPSCCICTFWPIEEIFDFVHMAIMLYLLKVEDRVERVEFSLVI